MGWYILGLLVVLIIQVCVASKFSSIAEEKGYHATSYFWLCFLLGVIGYCMVAALPDLALHNKIDNLSKSNKDIVETVQVSTNTKPVMDDATIPRVVVVNPTSPSTRTPPLTETNTSTPVSPINAADGEIICPACGTKQLANRKVCWNCGQKFSCQ